MALQFCRYEKKGHVAYVTITRPEVYNALHYPAHVEFASVWDDFAADDDLWVAVLTGEGDRAFSAGNDLKYAAMVSRMPENERPRTGMTPTGFGGLTHRWDLFKPVIARVNGYALGGGLELAMACDIIIAVDDTEVGLPEPRRGLIAGAVGVHRLPRQVPLKAAMLHMLTGRHMSTKRAYELGLVSELVSRADLDDAVERCVQDILRCAPLSVRATKEAAMLGLDMSLPNAAAASYAWEERRRRSADAIEGPRAFAEKREPRWTGR